MIILDNKIDFTAIMIPQKTNQTMQYWSEKVRKVLHDENRPNGSANKFHKIDITQL